MKKVLALALIFIMLLSSCAPATVEEENTTLNDEATKIVSNKEAEVKELGFTDLSDERLLTYVEDEVYNELLNEIDGEKYYIENVESSFISKEYLDELEYNSKENIYFGYNLSDLIEEFGGNNFVFTVDENGETIATEFKAYDDTYEKVVRDVATGTGVILICVTVSALTVTNAPAVSLILAASAKTGTAFALSSGAISGIAAGAITGYETKDYKTALKAAASTGAESFKWGAITGVIAGGAGKTIALKGATANGLTMNEAAAIQRESGYPLSVIKSFKSKEQYEICKEAGLTTKMVNGNNALVRDIDLTIKDEFGRTNLERMKSGLAPLDSTGASYELHHVGQKTKSPLAILTQAEHRGKDNFSVLHDLTIDSEVHNVGNDWNAQKAAFWKALAHDLIKAAGA